MKSFHLLFAICFLSFFSNLSGYAQPGICGNELPQPCLDCEDEEAPPCPGINQFHPYNGNAHREILDLEVWGGVGEIPLVLMRYHNSRGIRNWQVSYNYQMMDDGFTSQGQAVLEVNYPEGGMVIIFKVRLTLQIGYPDRELISGFFRMETIFSYNWLMATVTGLKRSLIQPAEFFTICGILKTVIKIYIRILTTITI